MRCLSLGAIVTLKRALDTVAYFIASRRYALRDILLKGRQRGELRPEVDIELVIDLVYGAMWYRLLNRHAPLNRRFARQLAEWVGAGIRPHP